MRLVTSLLHRLATALDRRPVATPAKIEHVNEELGRFVSLAGDDPEEIVITARWQRAERAPSTTPGSQG
jgi:hypothetical protein